MSIEEFVENLESLFVESDVKFSPTTDFRDNDEFDSLVGFSIIVFIKDHFGYNMTVEEFLNCKTIEDLYSCING